MKKIFGIAIAWVLMSTVSFGQDTNVHKVDLTAKDKKCIPTKECAAKAGVSLEECKKVCAGKSATTASVASASLVSDVEATTTENGASKKECTKTKTACAASAVKETKVAAATMVNEIEETPETQAKAKKCSKTCTKKK